MSTRFALFIAVSCSLGCGGSSDEAAAVSLAQDSGNGETVSPVLPETVSPVLPETVSPDVPEIDSPDVPETTTDIGVLPPTGEVLVNEVMASNKDTLEDGDGDSADWIELYNASGTTVELEGWGLSDNPDAPFAWVFPSKTLLAGQFLVVWASGKGSTGPSDELHTSFKLDASGEALVLTRPDGQPSDVVTFPALGEDVSWGREQQVTSTQPVAEGSPARLSLDPPAGWEDPGFEEGGWQAVVLGVGYAASVLGSTPENAALEKPTTQSSDGYGRTGAQAVDGEPSTFSHTGDGDLAPWWRVDLGAPYLVTGVTLLNRSNCCPERLYNVTVSLQDSAGAEIWASDVLNPVAVGATPTSPGNRLDVAPAAPVIARFATVAKTAVNSAGSSEWMSLAEVVVDGSLASPYSEDITTDLLAQMKGVSSIAAIRADVAADSLPSRATLSVRFDDGFAAWVGGSPVASANHGGGVATAANDGALETVLPIDPNTLTGATVLAIQGLNQAADDDDFLLLPTLTLDWIETGDAAFFPTPTPGEPNGLGVLGFLEEPIVVPPRGFYAAPVTATVTTSTPGATLVYTLDGSVPTQDHGTVVLPVDGSAVAAASIPITTTSLLRAAAFADGWAPSPVATHTYVYVEDVIRQPAAPAGLPTVWDGLSEAAYAADYEMDPEVVDDPDTHDDLLAGLRGIPTLSVVMDPADLWGAEGIYINSAERGDKWERPVSIELILPDGSTAFQEDCGIQIHGWGWRYHSATLKHSFRLDFKEEYGPSKLTYPWFADAPVEKFDSIVPRAGGSKTWLDFRDPEQAQYLHDSFARDSARDMGKVDGHATYVHLYLNGLYWGLYNPVERPDAGFAEEYFGGEDSDYDAINRRTTTNEAVDGDLVAYEALLALADADLSLAENYAAIEAMLELDDLIDYMLIHQYTVNHDGPCCFESNNMRGIRKREDGAQFRFFVWDMEYSLWEAGDNTNVQFGGRRDRLRTRQRRAQSQATALHTRHPTPSLKLASPPRTRQPKPAASTTTARCRLIEASAPCRNVAHGLRCRSC